MVKILVSYMVFVCSFGVWYRVRSGKVLLNECVVK